MDPDEKRSDPFWEFGNFGITGCHDKNLMNPKKVDRLVGSRFAFAQGGPLGTRLVYLTPPLTVIKCGCRVEVKWKPFEMPFRYNEASILARNGGGSLFPQLEAMYRDVARSTDEGRLASRFRARAIPLDPAIANEVIRVYSKMRKGAPNSAFAVCYTDALPKLPPVVDENRKATYARYRDAEKAGSTHVRLARAYAANSKTSCKICNEFARADSKLQKKPSKTRRKRSRVC
jgi:hypothetical protein